MVILQIAKFVVGLGEKVAPTDIEESMRVGVDRVKHEIQLPLPPRIDPIVSLMVRRSLAKCIYLLSVFFYPCTVKTVEDKPDVSYDDVGGCKEALEKLREVNR